MFIIRLSPYPVMHLYRAFTYLKYPFTMFTLYRNRIENGCIDVIKFSDKNRWRQGKIALGFPELLSLCRLQTFNVSPPSLCYVRHIPIEAVGFFRTNGAILLFLSLSPVLFLYLSLIGENGKFTLCLTNS